MVVCEEKIKIREFIIDDFEKTCCDKKDSGLWLKKNISGDYVSHNLRRVLNFCLHDLELPC